MTRRAFLLAFGASVGACGAPASPPPSAPPAAETAAPSTVPAPPTPAGAATALPAPRADLPSTTTVGETTFPLRCTTELELTGIHVELGAAPHVIEVAAGCRLTLVDSQLDLLETEKGAATLRLSGGTLKLVRSSIGSRSDRLSVTPTALTATGGRIEAVESSFVGYVRANGTTFLASQGRVEGIVYCEGAGSIELADATLASESVGLRSRGCDVKLTGGKIVSKGEAPLDVTRARVTVTGTVIESDRAITFGDDARAVLDDVRASCAVHTERGHGSQPEPAHATVHRGSFASVAAREGSEMVVEDATVEGAATASKDSRLRLLRVAVGDGLFAQSRGTVQAKDCRIEGHTGAAAESDGRVVVEGGEVRGSKAALVARDFGHIEIRGAQVVGEVIASPKGKIVR